MGHAEDDTVWDDVSNEVWEASHHSLIPLNQIAASERTKVIRINPYHRLGREIYQTHNEITKKITWVVQSSLGLFKFGTKYESPNHE